MSYKQISPLAVADGGTGVATLTSGQALIGNGASAFTSVVYTTPTAITPVLQFGGASVGITYTTQLGNYWQIGKLVFIEVNIVLSAKGSSVGDATVLMTGLPASITQVASIPLSLTVSNLGFVTVPIIRKQATSATIILEEVTSTGAITTIVDTDFVDTSVIRFGGCYITT